MLTPSTSVVNTTIIASPIAKLRFSNSDSSYSGLARSHSLSTNAATKNTASTTVASMNPESNQSRRCPCVSPTDTATQITTRQKMPK